ncbi:efflux transporter outer membrane subunit [Desulfogranum marinum]|uniref:efflux transporter outer membrane subunit n=1 Tax=Desulfogranum marinum TaxID=453220 RepID=UPI0029C73A04|nr:efflux transporter outer membrane subunit [Desulfogranum marinum]
MKSSCFLIVLTALLCITGCSLHTVDNEAQPSVQVPQSFPSLGNPTRDDEMEPKEIWWLNFNRPQLSTLIQQAFTANQDIVAAVSRIQQARSLQIQSRSDLFPKIDMKGNVADGTQGSDASASISEVGLALNWEIDLFDRISSTAMANEYQALAREEDLQALRLSLSTEVANAYFGAVAAQKGLQLLQSQVETDQALLELLELRQKSGVGTNVEVLQQKGQVYESKGLIPPIESILRVFENRLDVLLGQPPDGLNRIDPKETLAFASTLPSVGVPTDLLLNRHDLQAAHAELVAADADIAAAIADRLPQITLTGSYLYSEDQAYSGIIGTIIGGFVQPILDWGKRKAEVERNRALYTERLATFTQLFLEAVEQVENALYQEIKQREYLARLGERLAILQDTVKETEARYTQGVDDYLPVLYALQDLRSVERSLVSERLNLIAYRISLYQAIGGSTSSVRRQEG